jgi:hypothetical protein
MKIMAAASDVDCFRRRLLPTSIASGAALAIGEGVAGLRTS